MEEETTDGVQFRSQKGSITHAAVRAALNVSAQSEDGIIEPVTTAVVADACDAPERTVLNRLHDLEAAGQARRKKLNDTMFLWFPRDDE